MIRHFITVLFFLATSVVPVAFVAAGVECVKESSPKTAVLCFVLAALTVMRYQVKIGGD